jgi:undecaprenyl-diphosphatase
MDVKVFRAVFEMRWEPLTPVMRFFTLVGTAGAVWGVIAAVAFVLGGFYLPGLLVPWAAVAGSWILAEASKHLFNRARPHASDMGIAPLVKTPSSSSFPSGHSATAAAGAVSLSAAYPVLALAFAAVGLITMFSRIYLGVHYPSDVLAGAAIGMVCAGLLLPLA